MLIEALTAPFKALQKASSPSIDDPRLWYPFLWGATRSGSSKPFTIEDAIYCSVAWRCCTLISGTVAKLDFNLKRKFKDGTTELALDHPVQKLLTVAPNEEETPFNHKYAMMMRVLLFGDHFAHKRLNGRGEIAAMSMLAPWNMTISRDRGTQKLVYDYTDGEGRHWTLDRAQIVHLSGPSINAVSGIATCQAAVDAIKLCRDIMRFRGDFFDNDATPPGALIAPTPLKSDAIQTMRESWEAAHAGRANRKKIAILHSGVKFEKFAQTMEEAEFTEGELEVISHICRFFGVPEHKVGILRRSTNNNIQQQAQEYYDDCMDPHLTNIQQTYERDLLKPAERGSYCVEADVDDLLWADAEKKYEKNNKEVLAGIRLINEGRAVAGLNRLDGGDVLLVPGANTPMMVENGKLVPVIEPVAPAVAKPTEEEEPDEDDDEASMPASVLKAFEPLLLDAAGRVVSCERSDLLKGLDKRQDIQAAREFIRDFYTNRWRASLIERLEPVALAASGVLTEDELPPARVEQLAAALSRETQDRLLQLFDESDDPYRAVRVEVASWINGASRAREITRRCLEVCAEEVPSE